MTAVPALVLAIIGSPPAVAAFPGGSGRRTIWLTTRQLLCYCR